jgi:hypothetical protein
MTGALVVSVEWPPKEALESHRNSMRSVSSMAYTKKPRTETSQGRNPGQPAGA